jgi:hypothetical protein
MADEDPAAVGGWVQVFVLLRTFVMGFTCLGCSCSLEDLEQGTPAAIIVVETDAKVDGVEIVHQFNTPKAFLKDTEWTLTEACQVCETYGGTIAVLPRDKSFVHIATVSPPDSITIDSSKPNPPAIAPFVKAKTARPARSATDEEPPPKKTRKVRIEGLG